MLRRAQAWVASGSLGWLHPPSVSIQGLEVPSGLAPHLNTNADAHSPSLRPGSIRIVAPNCGLVCEWTGWGPLAAAAFSFPLPQGLAIP